MVVLNVLIKMKTQLYVTPAVEGLRYILTFLKLSFPLEIKKVKINPNFLMKIKES